MYSKHAYLLLFWGERVPPPGSLGRDISTLLAFTEVLLNRGAHLFKVEKISSQGTLWRIWILWLGDALSLLLDLIFGLDGCAGLHDLLTDIVEDIEGLVGESFFALEDIVGVGDICLDRALNGTIELHP